MNPIAMFLPALAVICVAFAPDLTWAQKPASAVLQKVSKLSPEQRRQALIEGAKAEKEVTYYSSLQAPQLEIFARAFNQQYPFLKVNSYRASGEKQVIRIQAENSAGRNLVDVVNSSAEEAAALKKIGVLEPYPSPQREFYPASAKDKEGYFTSLYVIPMVLGYNTNLVKGNDAPRSYEDLLNPKWKGQMFLDNEAYDWFAVLLRHFGKEKGLRYMRSLARQDLTLIRGRTAQTQLLAAGERAVAIALSGHTVLELKTKGAPIGWAALDPYFSHSNYMMFARHAPHPYAAALLTDWALSEEGQSVITTFGRVVARKGVKQRFPELGEKESIAVDIDFIGPILQETSKEFREIFIAGR